MSSVTRFLRQIPVSTTYYTVTTQTPSSVFYELTPDANSSGNYPGLTGYVSATTATTTITNMSLGSDVYLLRDMGKTIKCTVGAPTSGNTAQSFFREVQLIDPVDYASTFGVGGSTIVPSANAQYCTFYVPVAMPGFNSGLAPVAMTPVSGGQA